MKKKVTRILLCVAMVAVIVSTFSVTAFAAAEVDTSGGEGSTPVNLTTTNDGLVDTDGDGIPDTPGTVTPTKMSVIVPTVLPMAMSEDGVVVTADNCMIVNHSYGAVRVKSVTISAAADWHLTKFGDKSILAGEKVDSNKLGFAIAIGGGQQAATTNDDATQQLISAPMEGCYMSGIGDTAHNTAAIDYSAIVTPLSDAITNETVANVVFVIEWDTAA